MYIYTFVYIYVDIYIYIHIDVCAFVLSFVTLAQYQGKSWKSEAEPLYSRSLLTTSKFTLLRPQRCAAFSCTAILDSPSKPVFIRHSVTHRKAQ